MDGVAAAVQVRQADQRLKEATKMEHLTSTLAHTRSELAAVKSAAHQQAAYWDNFTTQLFRSGVDIWM
jgi:hypothetical protein